MKDLFTLTLISNAFFILFSLDGSNQLFEVPRGRKEGVGIHITLSNQAENEELVRAKGRQTNRLPLIPLLLILLLSFRPAANYFTWRVGIEERKLPSKAITLNL